jgi:hypothetical protein
VATGAVLVVKLADVTLAGAVLGVGREWQKQQEDEGAGQVAHVSSPFQAQKARDYQVLQRTF